MNSFALSCWWRWWDSNPWPPACRAGALPAELHPQNIIGNLLISYFCAFALVGPSGLEPPTSCLSGTRSNLLSYDPMWLVWFLSHLDFVERRKLYASFLDVSVELSSRTVARKVFSPLQSLTSVFGMGTGGPSAFVALTIQESLILENWTTIIPLEYSSISLNYVMPISPHHTFSIERRWSSRTFRYGYLVTT